MCIWCCLDSLTSTANIKQLLVHIWCCLNSLTSSTTISTLKLNLLNEMGLWPVHCKVHNICVTIQIFKMSLKLIFIFYRFYLIFCLLCFKHFVPFFIKTLFISFSVELFLTTFLFRSLLKVHTIQLKLISSYFFLPFFLFSLGLFYLITPPLHPKPRSPLPHTIIVI